MKRACAAQRTATAVSPWYKDKKRSLRRVRHRLSNNLFHKGGLLTTIMPSEAEMNLKRLLQDCYKTTAG
jgi:hypothetical protein